MTLVVEDGTGRPDAESLGTVDGFKAWAKARGLTVPGSTLECEVLLRKGMEPMQGLSYKGCRASRDQALDFPRIGVEVDGFCYGANELPPQLALAQYALAHAAQTVDLMPTTAAGARGAVIEQTVDIITTRYAEPSIVSTRPQIERAKSLLRPLLRGGGGIPLVRA